MAAMARSPRRTKALELIESWREGADKVEALAKQTTRALEQGQLDKAADCFR